MATIGLAKILKIIRIEKGVRLYDMAKNLGISPSYLSSIETGRKSPPQNIEDKIITLYDLTGKQAKDLKDAILEARENWTITPKTIAQKETTELFARKVNSLSEDKLAKILKMLNSDGEE